LLKGDSLIRRAWQARGTGFASTVTAEHARQFEEQLEEARQVLEGAWSIRPGFAQTANLMLEVELGASRGRAEMEKWFERAMEADANNSDACSTKLNWLDPKWYGTREEMVTFGRACRDTGNWRRGITLLVVEAHDRVSPKLATDAARNEYMRSSEVWDDVRTVYTEYFKHHPLDDVSRSKYAVYCYLSGRYEMSHGQFLIVGENLRWDKRFTEEFTKQVRAFVAKSSPPQPGEKKAK
jgi:hypothetical protein